MTRTKFDLARLDVVQGRSAAVIPVLKKLVEETETVGLKALSVQSSIYLAQALLASGKPQDAQQELDRALNRAEKLGLRSGTGAGPLPISDRFIARTGKTNQYAPQYQEAVRILESISKEAGRRAVAGSLRSEGRLSAGSEVLPGRRVISSMLTSAGALVPSVFGRDTKLR